MRLLQRGVSTLTLSGLFGQTCSWTVAGVYSVERSSEQRVASDAQMTLVSQPNNQAHVRSHSHTRQLSNPSLYSRAQLDLGHWRIDATELSKTFVVRQACQTLCPRQGSSHPIGEEDARAFRPYHVGKNPPNIAEPPANKVWLRRA